MKTNRFLSFAAMLFASLLFSCTTNIEPPPPPLAPSSSSVVEPSNYCVYQETRQCFSTPQNTCPAGGELSTFCPFPTQSSSSPAEVPSGSSSSQAGQSSNSDAVQSSSSGTTQEYSYCVFSADRTCFSGTLTVCPPGGELSNTCPYSSSGTSTVSSSGGVAASSSSGVSLPSSSGGVVPSSSESQALGTFDGTYFTDPRDGKKYKYETDHINGRIWMSENLGYSRGNTLGWCYNETQYRVLGNAGANSSSCDSPYGRNYTWEMAMDGNSSRGLCPKGWHIPTIAEWTAVGAGTSTSQAGTRKMSSNFYVYPGNYDNYGEYESREPGWYDREKMGPYWTSNNKNSWVLMGIYVYSGETYGYFFWKNDAMDIEYFSIRCIADEGVFNLPSSSQLKSSTMTVGGSTSAIGSFVDIDDITTYTVSQVESVLSKIDMVYWNSDYIYSPFTAYKELSNTSVADRLENAKETSFWELTAEQTARIRNATKYSDIQDIVPNLYEANIVHKIPAENGKAFAVRTTENKYRFVIITSKNMENITITVLDPYL